MNISDLKNIVVLKNLPSNIVEEAIVVLKPNKKIHKYQIINAREDNESSKEKYEPNNKESSQKNCKAKIENNKEDNKEDNTYIIKEAEMLVKSYTENLEKKRPNNRKIEQKLRKSIIVNIILSIITVLAIILSLL